VRIKKKINFSMCDQLQAQRSCCGVFRGQMYHQHRVQGILQSGTVGVLQGTDISAQGTGHTVEWSCGGITGERYHQHRVLGIL
jgi:hypothetical protein